MDRTDYILDRDFSVADMAPIVRVEEHGLPGTEQWPVDTFLEREPSKKWYLFSEEEKATLEDCLWRARIVGRGEGLVIGVVVGMLLIIAVWMLNTYS